MTFCNLIGAQYFLCIAQVALLQFSRPFPNCCLPGLVRSTEMVALKSPFPFFLDRGNDQLEEVSTVGKFIIQKL